MKTLILTTLLGLASASALAQGTLNFANVGVGVNAPVWLGGIGTGTKLSGTDWLAQLWYGPAGTPEWKLTPHSHMATFFTQPQYAGYFAGGVRTLSGFDGGSVATVQVRIFYRPQLDWGWLGQSKLIDVTLSTPPATPRNLVGLEPFCVIPEPAGLTLVSFGLSTLVMLRRRK